MPGTAILTKGPLRPLLNRNAIRTGRLQPPAHDRLLAASDASPSRPAWKQSHGGFAAGPSSSSQHGLYSAWLGRSNSSGCGPPSAPPLLLRPRPASSRCRFPVPLPGSPWLLRAGRLLWAGQRPCDLCRGMCVGVVPACLWCLSFSSCLSLQGSLKSEHRGKLTNLNILCATFQ